MRWIISIFILLDVIYQLFGDATSINWCIYYDVIHFGVLLSICLFYLYKKGDLLLGVFATYFGLIIFNILYQIGLTKEEYLQNVTLDYKTFGYFTIFILLIFTGYKLWGKLKRIG